jgi:hypothetical protein
VSFEDEQTAMPYLDLAQSRPDSAIDMDSLIDNIAEAVFGPVMSDPEREDIARYIEAAGKYAGSQPHQSNASAGGLMLTVYKNGSAKALLIRDIRELLMTPKMILEKRLNREKALEQERQLKLQRRLTRGRTTGREK